MNDILAKILRTKHDEVAAHKRDISLEDMKKLAVEQLAPRGFVAALKQRTQNQEWALIAEIKKASPSKGLIREDFNPSELAKTYEAAGASCLSVLTDIEYFQGSPEYLKAAKAACHLPVLRKDFIVDEYQIYQARAWGADAILLIAAALTQAQLEHFETIAHQLGMGVLLEVHHLDEWEKCHNLSTELIGVNNRNLRTFEVDLQQTIDFLPLLQGKIIVSESGIATPEDIALMNQHQVYTFLIGETFMRADNVGAAVQALMAPTANS